MSAKYNGKNDTIRFTFLKSKYTIRVKKEELTMGYHPIEEEKEAKLFSESYATTLSSKNQVTLPAKVRERMNVEAGDQIIFSIDEKDNVIVNVMKKDSLLSLFGSMPPRGETIQREWTDIRKKMREERFPHNHE